MRILLRDFDTARLDDQAELLRQRRPTASVAEFPGATIDVAVTPQYRNMAEGLAPRAAGGGLRPAGPGAAGPRGPS